MIMRAIFALLLFAPLFLIGPAESQTVAPPTVAPPTVTPPTEADVLQLGIDIPGRMTVPVKIGTSGPFPFTIDTGAERTVISDELAQVLQLQPGRNVRVTSMTGANHVRTAIVPSLRVSTAGADRIEAPRFRGSDLGAPGLLGLDSLAGHSVSIDFERNEIRLIPARRRPSDFGNRSDEIVIQAKSMFRQLVVSEAFYRGRRIRVILDTGTSVSLGNLAMLDLVKSTMGNVAPLSLTSVTGATLIAQYAQVKNVKIGLIEFQSLPVAFADAAPFAAFGLRNKPALLLGMDALRLFRRVDIDFANREVRVSLLRKQG